MSSSSLPALYKGPAFLRRQPDNDDWQQPGPNIIDVDVSGCDVGAGAGAGFDWSSFFTDDDDGTNEEKERLTELRNAEVLDELHGNDLLWNSSRKTWLWWNSRHWAVDEDGYALACAKDVAVRTRQRLLDAGIDSKAANAFANKTESSYGVSAMLALLRSAPGRSASESDFDSDPSMLNVANGALDLDTMSLLPHDRNQRMSSCLSTPYNPNATVPIWEAFLNTIMDGDQDMIGYLQRLAGYCLSGRIERQEMYIAHGRGANGKSVFFDTLTALLESYASVAPESLLTARRGGSDHPTGLARLSGKRMVIVSETETEAKLRIQAVKRLTGDETLTARFMRQDFFQFCRTFKLFMITNNRPRVTEHTEALWRRLRLIPFEVVIPEDQRNPALLQQLRAEFPGILAWAVDGLRAYYSGGMQTPDKVTAATRTYRDEMDEIPEFVRDFCECGDPTTHWVSRKAIYDAYTDFAEGPDQPEFLKRSPMYDRLKQMPGIKERNPKVDGKKTRGFAGLKLRARSAPAS